MFDPGDSGPETGRGGGVYNTGTLVMHGSATIHDNSAGVAGGGIHDAGGTLTGVLCAPGTLANVYGNTPDDCYFAE